MSYVSCLRPEQVFCTHPYCQETADMTQTETLTLTDFLLARIAEDEAMGRRVYVATFPGGGTVTCNGELVVVSHAPPRRVRKAMAAHGLGGDTFELTVGERTAAECEAKRRIVDMHGGDRDDCRSCSGRVYGGGYPCDTLCALALPYADHSEFREEWRA